MQQYLPFTVLKRLIEIYKWFGTGTLQQYLPFTVLKLHGKLIFTFWTWCSCNSTYRLRYWNWTIYWDWISRAIDVATVLTVYGIETIRHQLNITISYHLSCNSTYRLRYWNSNTIESPYALSLQQYLPFTVLKLPYGLIL